MKTVKDMQAELSAKYPTQMLCDLPDHEFDCGGLVWGLTLKTGHHSGRATIGGLGLWTVPAKNLLQFLR